jgi:hypothetical protein
VFRWWIIDIHLEDRIVLQRSLDDPSYKRPPEARPLDDGDINTPYFQTREHTHLPARDGCLGGHVRATSFLAAVERTLQLLKLDPATPPVLRSQLGI